MGLYITNTTEVREQLRMTTCFNRAKELLACAELDSSRSVVGGNQTATELQYLCNSDKSYAAHDLKSPL